MPVVGFLGAASPKENAPYTAWFGRGLNEAGFADGKNVAIDYRWADGHYDRLPELAAELVRDQVAVIFASGGTPSARAAMAATTSIPIIFSVSDDPVKIGLVDSLRRPGGNVTGVTFVAASLGAKRWELLRELVPKASGVALLVNPDFPASQADRQQMESASRAIGQQILVLNAGSVRDIDAAFATLAQQRADALVVAVDAFFLKRREQIAGLAARIAVPAMYFEREFITAGGLMSYGTPLREAYHQAGIYAARILTGAKPADLPVIQATKFELVINLKTAKALGLTVPPALLARADEVIE